jgi:hypothetical protein
LKSADYLLIGLASLLLLAVNWLAFHDFREPHTGREWLMLLASLVVFIEFARIIWTNGVRAPSRK